MSTPPPTFEVAHLIFTDKSPEVVTDIPEWMRGRPGSTMDNAWFWEGYVNTLEVGESIDTEFRRITRIA